MRSGKKIKENTENTVIHIVSHTHWDREWYQPYQILQIRFVDFLDQLIDLMEKNKDFLYFTLDGQMVILEDYLEIRPENENRIKKLVKEGRILIGPWYVQSDEFLVSPESLIRNLMLGIKTAGKFGDPMMVGYLPDTFGHISTIPLILNGFGIKSAVFGRGRDKGKQEFLWESVDGSQVLAINQFYILGTIPPVTKEGYIRVCEYLPSSGKEQYELLKDKLKQMNKNTGIKSQLLLLSGIDHALPRSNLPEIIEECNMLLEDNSDELSGRYQLKQSTLPDYIESIIHRKKDLGIETGEMRVKDYHSFTGCNSSRIYLKIKNYICQQELERWSEPFSALAWLCGRKYPYELLWKSWRKLLFNHAHDSIYGCGVDEVHQDMLGRFNSSLQISEKITKDSLILIAEKINTGLMDNCTDAIVAFNPLCSRRSEIIEASINFNNDVDDFDNFHIYDENGSDLPLQISSCKEILEFEFHKHGTPDFKKFLRCNLMFESTDIPAYGYKTFFIKKEPPGNNITTSGIKKRLSKKINEAENEYIRITINKNGSFNLFDKKTGNTYRNLNLFEDGADIGDEFNYSPCQYDLKYISDNVKPQIYMIRNGLIETVFKIETIFKIPAYINSDRKARSKELTDLQICSYIKIKKNLPRIDIKTIVNNAAMDHRFRVIFPVDLKNASIFAGGHFDTIKRPALDKKRDGIDNTFPMRDFVLIKGTENPMAILSMGLTEYEIIESPARAIAITLFRSIGWLSRGDLLTRSDNCAYEISTPEAQCMGIHSFQYSILPLQKDSNETFLYSNLSRYAAPLRTISTGLHTGEFPLSREFIRITPDSMILSTIKKCDLRDSIIVRFYNPSYHNVDTMVNFCLNPEKVYRVRLDETREKVLEIKNKCVNIAVKAHEVVTIEIIFLPY